MGGAVSAGRDNDELIDNLKGGKYIRTPHVERVFRALDRADYMLPHSRDTAYKDLAWKDGPLHLSAPCIYSEVMEGLELRKGLSFLNVGSGTGYLSTMVGLILGSSGINHGIEINPAVVEYANHRHQEFIMKSWSVDEFDFCEPKFVLGNGLCLAPLQTQYERVYCGAGCPEEYANYFKQLVKVGGILVMPLMDSLIQVRRVTQSSWVSRSLLSVSFAQLKVPSKQETENLVKLDDISPPTLQVLCRAVIRNTMRDALLSKNPHLVPAPRRLPPRSVTGPRRICIPVEEDSDVETFSILHDLDTNNGGNEMNALLNLVLSMGQNRVAGSLLYDHHSTSSSSSSSSPSMTCVVNSSAESDAESDDPSAPEGDDEQGSSRSRTSDRRARSTTPMPTDAPDAGGSVSSNNDKRENSRGHDSTSDDSDDQNKAKRIKSKLRSKSKKRQRGQNKREPHAACTSSMEWDDAAVATTSDAATTSKSGSSQSEGNGDAKEKSKRQKFDSGIGEENSPENSSSIEKTETKSDQSEYSDCSSDVLDEGEKDEPDDGSRGRGTRRDGRAMKRSRHGMRARSSDSEDEEVQRGPRRRTKKRTKAAASADHEPTVEEQRRSTLTAHMKLASNMLPLPPPLRLFVNLGRAY